MSLPAVQHDDHGIRILQVALEGMRLLARGWQGRRVQQCPLCEYAPDVVRHHVIRWADLLAAADGVSASGVNPITSGGIRDRMKLVTIKADIELATDKAFTNGRYLGWDAVARIYRRQRRESYLLARRRELAVWLRAGRPDVQAPEPWKPLAEATCYELIAHELGWYPHDCEMVA